MQTLDSGDFQQIYQLISDFVAHRLEEVICTNGHGVGAELRVGKMA